MEPKVGTVKPVVLIVLLPEIVVCSHDYTSNKPKNVSIEMYAVQKPTHL